jgi:hypothetical protein
LGAALIATGTLVNLFSVRRFVHLAAEVDRNQFADRSLSRQGVFDLGAIDVGLPGRSLAPRILSSRDVSARRSRCGSHT